MSAATSSARRGGLLASACEQGAGSIPADHPPVKHEPSASWCRWPALSLIEPISGTSLIRAALGLRSTAAASVQPPPWRGVRGHETRLSPRPSSPLAKPSSATWPAQSRLSGALLYPPRPQRTGTVSSGSLAGRTWLPQQIDTAHTPRLILRNSQTFSTTYTFPSPPPCSPSTSPSTTPLRNPARLPRRFAFYNSVTPRPESHSPGCLSVLAGRELGGCG